MSSSVDDEAEGTLVMVSVSETSAEEEEEEEYRTPPERHSHTLTSSNEVDMEETVDLSGDSEVFGSECLRLNVSSAVQDEDVKKMEEEEDGFVGEVSRGVLGRLKNIEDNVMDEDLTMEEGGVPSSGCRGASAGVVGPVVEGNHGSSVNADIELGVWSGDVGAGRVNELKCIGKAMVEEAERIRCTATCACVSDSASCKVRKLPSSFCTANKGEDGGSCRVMTDKRHGGVETGQGGSSSRAGGTCGGNSSAGAEKGVNEPGIGDADDASGQKPSQTNEEEEEEPNEDELTENILKVLGLLARPQRPVYNEKVDIIGSAIKAGVTFPRPSWWPEDSDDDSN